MWRLTLCFVAASWLLVSASFGADATPNLSDLEKQAATDAAQVEKVEVAAPDETIADYSRYRMEEESNRLILALAVMGTGLFALFDLPPVSWTPGYATAALASYSAGES
ncbi:MAG: hypothetical protein Nkreftii_002742 [Candidatus Nitrospira kreftii]|uniref:Uncharacterized protein n=1 Tax=Candidatus Nitrospira kreftii TaxID=2652173 RepID=A0A7S8J054_9BACT|nr:MAG: hypothetical protein Nkreftii_002742 [Candidatus Nitrospira kreftii]